MMGITGMGNVGRFAKRLSYGDTRSGFRVGTRGRKHGRAGIRKGTPRKIYPRKGTPRKIYPKIKPRRTPAAVSFSQDFIAPLMLVLLGAASVIAAIAAMPVNGSGLVIFVAAAAVIVAVGILAAGKAAKRRKMYLHEER
jgi:hypothetical protein